MTAKAGLAKLREPFPSNQIGKLPKPYKADSPKGNCKECGGYHGLPALHLDFVGHAALTDRLLDVDPEWTWAPMAVAPDGSPVMDRHGGLWITLTVLGVTRPGYGDAQGKSGGNAIKEAIGDALRNAGMRFGLALDLWHKGDLHAAAQDVAQSEPESPARVDISILKRQIVKEGERLGWSINDVANDFSGTKDKPIANATADDLTVYLAELKKMATPERLPV